MDLRTLLALGAMAGAVAVAGAAAAQSSEGTATIQTTFRGQADPGCRLSTPTAPTTENAQVGALGPGSVHEGAALTSAAESEVPIASVVVEAH